MQVAVVFIYHYISWAHNVYIWTDGSGSNLLWKILQI